jgi:hypothetical protein
MPVNGTYSVTSDDGQGPVLVALTANNLPWTGPVRSSSGCIDLYGNIYQAGATVDLWGCNGSAAQNLTMGPGSTLRVGSASSAWCLGAAGGRTAPGTRVKLQSCDGSAGQRFRWGLSTRLVNPVSKLCVEPLNGSSLQGTVLVLASCSSADYQKWDLSELVATRGELSSGLGAVHQLCLTDVGAVSQPGTPVEIDPCTTTPSQIVTHWGSQLRVVNQCLTAGAARPVSSASVRLMPCNGARTQAFTSLTGGRLQNPQTKLCLAVRGARSAPGTPITLVTCALTAAQRWRLPG